MWDLVPASLTEQEIFLTIFIQIKLKQFSNIYK